MVWITQAMMLDFKEVPKTPERSGSQIMANNQQEWIKYIKSLWEEHLFSV